MLFRFVCKEHDFVLNGYPQWKLMHSNPDEFEVDFRDMWCPNDGTGEDRACKASWAIEFMQKVTIPRQRNSDITGHSSQAKNLDVPG